MLVAVDSVVIVAAVALAQIGRFQLLSVDDPGDRASWGRVTVLSIALGSHGL
jgi:hypothetical protein